MDHSKKARENFLCGYSCAQAVLLAFSDLTGLDEHTALLISSSFGGGMGRLREVCGAVSGAFFVFGATLGYDDPKDLDGKKALYATVQDFARRFKLETGSIICRELLEGVPTQAGGEPEPRTETYYKKRPCADLVLLSAQIAETILTEKGIL